jgi:proteic killer suppression protein
MLDMSYHVFFAKQAEKDILKIPEHIAVKLQAWIDDVEERGLSHASRSPGFHDERLEGKLSGLRSIRLSRSYRAVYEVHKHAYKK